jgi:ribosomal protein L19E
MWTSVESVVSALSDNAMRSRNRVEKLCEQRWIAPKKEREITGYNANKSAAQSDASWRAEMGNRKWEKGRRDATSEAHFRFPISHFRRSTL